MLLRGSSAAVLSFRQLPSRNSRRFASHSAPNGESAYHVAGGSGSESFGRGFYITISLIPLGLVGWTLATSSQTAQRITDFIQYVGASRIETDNRRSMLHQAAVEQAASDRHIFSSAAPSHHGVDLRFPEILNRSSPWNVAAGEGGADLTKLMEHYSRQNEQAEQDRLARTKQDGKVTTVYDDTTGGRFPSWVPWIGTSKKVAPESRE